MQLCYIRFSIGKKNNDIPNIIYYLIFFARYPKADWTIVDNFLETICVVVPTHNLFKSIRNVHGC